MSPPRARAREDAAEAAAAAASAATRAVWPCCSGGRSVRWGAAGGWGGAAGWGEVTGACRPPGRGGVCRYESPRQPCARCGRAPFLSAMLMPVRLPQHPDTVGTRSLTIMGSQRTGCVAYNELGAAEVHGKRSDVPRSDLKYAACEKYLKDLNRLQDQYPCLKDSQELFSRWANIAELGSIGRPKKSHTVWLVPVNEFGEYDPNGRIPTDYVHKASLRSSEGPKVSQCPLVTAGGKLVWLSLNVQVRNEETACIQPDWVAAPRHPLISEDLADNCFFMLTKTGSCTSEYFFDAFVHPKGIIAAVKRFMKEENLQLDEKHPFVITLDFPPSVYQQYWAQIEGALKKAHIIAVRVPAKSTVDSNMLHTGVFAHFKKQGTGIIDAVTGCSAQDQRRLDLFQPWTTVPCPEGVPLAVRTFGMSETLNPRTQILLHLTLWTTLLHEKREIRKKMGMAATKCGIVHPHPWVLDDWRCLRNHRKSSGKSRDGIVPVGTDEVAEQQKKAAEAPLPAKPTGSQKGPSRGPKRLRTVS
eukprot:scaffold1169_cov367-Prasinococcus_capsulatus_cf.AAC.11